METKIAYSQPQNLQDLLTSEKGVEGKGRGGSAFLQAQNPSDCK